MKRLSAQELREKHDDLNEKVRALESRIRARLKKLIQAHPDAVIGITSDNVQLKARGLDNPYYLDNMDIDGTLMYIEKIEKYLADQHPHQQQKLFN
jgi:hypothetical protein